MQEKIGTKFYNLFHGVNFCWSLLRVWIYRRGRVTLNFGVLLHCYCQSLEFGTSLCMFCKIHSAQKTNFLQNWANSFSNLFLGLYCVCSAYYTVQRTSFLQNWANFFYNFFRLHCVCFAYYTVQVIVFYKTGQILCTICFFKRCLVPLAVQFWSTNHCSATICFWWYLYSTSFSLLDTTSKWALTLLLNLRYMIVEYCRKQIFLFDSFVVNRTQWSNERCWVDSPALSRIN